jgi:hypothetical protein
MTEGMAVKREHKEGMKASESIVELIYIYRFKLH